MITTRLSSKGQVVIPKKIRDLMKIEPGNLLGISSDGKKIILEPLGKSAAAKIYGKYRHVPLVETLETEHEEELTKKAGS